MWKDLNATSPHCLGRATARSMIRSPEIARPAEKNLALIAQVQQGALASRGYKLSVDAGREGDALPAGAPADCSTDFVGISWTEWLC